MPPPHDDRREISMHAARLLAMEKASREAAIKAKTCETIMDAGQDRLPSLPIPPLEQTLSRYLASVRPLTTDAEYKQTERFVDEFLGRDLNANDSTATSLSSSPSFNKKSQGWRLDHQLRLHAQECEQVQQHNKTNNKTKKEKTSWLAEWWDQWAYFQHRDSSTFFVNYYFGFQDDTRMPTQTARAALLVSLALEFRQLIATRTLTPDMARNAPFCMNMYNYLFNWSRIAEPNADRAVGFPTAINNHITVVRGGKFYIFETQHDPNRPESVLSPREIMIQLERIKKMADDDKSVVPKIGILSTGQRDQAAVDRMLLMEAHVGNKAHMAKLDSSAFVVCLDTSSPKTCQEFSRALWHGDGSTRWFDKCFQLMVFANGRAGLNGEHSKMDATPTSRMCRYLIDEAALRPLPDFRNLNATDLYEMAAALDKPAALTFVTSNKLNKAILNAEIEFKRLVDAHEVVPTEFKGYGKGLIKQFGMSPDAYVQMALQLAYFKKHGEFVATYESAATRKYRHGRTETARSCSIESKAFVDAMMNPTTSSRERVKLCRAAVAQHAKYTAWAVDGQAVDRHLLGLRLIRDANEPIPAMFQDPVFAKSCRWRLSTSQISDDCFIAYGWGEVVPDGFGCAYMVKETELFFCLTSLHLGSEAFGQHIVDALVDMRTMFEEVRKIEKAEAAQAAQVAAAAAAMSLAERQAAQAATVTSDQQYLNGTTALAPGARRPSISSPLLIPRATSPLGPQLPAPRTSLFFQKHDPILRTALARSALHAAQERYFSGIDDIQWDPIPASTSTNPTMNAGGPLSPKPKKSPTSPTLTATATGRARSPSTSHIQNFMAILMGEDNVLSRLRSRRASNAANAASVVAANGARASSPAMITRTDSAASSNSSNSSGGSSSSLRSPTPMSPERSRSKLQVEHRRIESTTTSSGSVSDSDDDSDADDDDEVGGSDSEEQQVVQTRSGTVSPSSPRSPTFPSSASTASSAKKGKIGNAFAKLVGRNNSNISNSSSSSNSNNSNKDGGA